MDNLKRLFDWLMHWMSEADQPHFGSGRQMLGHPKSDIASERVIRGQPDTQWSEKVPSLSLPVNQGILVPSSTQKEEEEEEKKQSLWPIKNRQ